MFENVCHRSNLEGGANMHTHVCFLCGKKSGCDADCGMSDGSVSEATCGSCQARLDAVRIEAAARRRLPNDAGIHMHACPRCGRGWDCSNECGVVDGSLSEATCGLCMEHVVAVGTPLAAAPTVIEHMPHMHVCVINDHIWEHLDADCGFETMMEPEKMRHLECPECFVFLTP